MKKLIPILSACCLLSIFSCRKEILLPDSENETEHPCFFNCDTSQLEIVWQEPIQEDTGYYWVRRIIHDDNKTFYGAYDPKDPNNTGGGDEEGGNEGGYNQGKVKFGSNGFPVLTIKGYPNPTDGEFTIPLEEGQYHFRLFDIFGKKVLSGDYNSTIRLDMTAYEKGMYLIHIENTDTGEMKSGKVIVQ